MKRLLLLSMLLLSLLGSTGAGWAQGTWRDLPPEERRQMRQQMREQWHQDRDVRREDHGRRWQEVPPDERRRMREEMREQRGWQEYRDGRSGRGGRRD
ncbi:MAG: hypothetical protein Q8S26_13375 [Azonexus sp.]|nr:hypothetical protein [Azonexus sp.]